VSKIAATKANQVVTDVSGASAGFAGIGSVGESDATTLTPNTRNIKGNPVGITTFAGNDNQA
jgi:hypothetical protein